MYDSVWVVVPENTEIHSPNHDYNGLAKIVPSVTVQFNIVNDSCETLPSRRNDGYGKVQFEVHDGVFHQSINYHHVASFIRIICQGHICMLVRDNKFPLSVANVTISI